MGYTPAPGRNRKPKPPPTHAPRCSYCGQPKKATRCLNCGAST